MSFLLRATFVIPYQPYPVQCDLIKNLVVGNRFQRLVTAPNLVSVQTSVDAETAGEEVMRKFGTGLSQIMDADIKAKVYLTPIGERRKVEMEFGRRKKATNAAVPVQPKPVQEVPVQAVPVQAADVFWKVTFSASMKQSGATCQFSLIRNGKLMVFKKDIQLTEATNAHEAAYDAVECALIHLRSLASAEECAGAGLALVSASQLVIKQLRGEWKIDSDGLIDRGKKIQHLLGDFERSKISFHLPGEVNVPAGAVA